MQTRKYRKTSFIKMVEAYNTLHAAIIAWDGAKEGMVELLEKKQTLTILTNDYLGTKQYDALMRMSETAHYFMCAKIQAYTVIELEKIFMRYIREEG